VGVRDFKSRGAERHRGSTPPEMRGTLLVYLREQQQQQQQQVGREGGREGRTDASLMPPGGGA